MIMLWLIRWLRQHNHDRVLTLLGVHYRVEFSRQAPGGVEGDTGLRFGWPGNGAQQVAGYRHHPEGNPGMAWTVTRGDGDTSAQTIGLCLGESRAVP